MLIDIPAAQGITIYIFAGPTMRDAIARYNLFSGGGCLPPRWGLGNWYRCKGDFDQKQVQALGKGLRDDKVPCDVLGLEPGWQSHSYSCSHVWSNRFKKPASLLASLGKLKFRANLWTHAFTHPSSPIYKKLVPYAGEHEVFAKGIVPDFSLKATRDIFAKHYDTTGVALG